MLTQVTGADYLHGSDIIDKDHSIFCILCHIVGTGAAVLSGNAVNITVLIDYLNDALIGDHTGKALLTCAVYSDVIVINTVIIVIKVHCLAGHGIMPGEAGEHLAVFPVKGLCVINILRIRTGCHIGQLFLQIIPHQNATIPAGVRNRSTEHLSVTSRHRCHSLLAEGRIVIKLEQGLYGTIIQINLRNCAGCIVTGI